MLDLHYNRGLIWYIAIEGYLTQTQRKYETIIGALTVCTLHQGTYLIKRLDQTKSKVYISGGGGLEIKKGLN